MSQDELAEKLGVSRQSISLWETDQTQPTIDNIVALAKVFNISTDMLLSDDTTETELSKNPLIDENISNTPKKERKKISLTQEIIIFGAIFFVLIAIIVAILLHKNSNDIPTSSDDIDDTSEATVESDNSDFAENSSDETTSTSFSDSTKEDSGDSISGGEINSTIPSTPDSSDQNSNNTSSTSKVDTSSPSTPDSSDKSTNSTPANSTSTSTSNSSDKNTNKNQSTGDVSTSAPTITTPEFDLFTYCKNFAIQIGQLKGDFCMYQQEATKYGGYENEYFSISYWADSDMVEFCLHCPLSDTLSENFYLRMRCGYNNTYEYLTSKYYRVNTIVIPEKAFAAQEALSIRQLFMTAIL